MAVALPAFIGSTIVVMGWSVSSVATTLASTVVTVGGSMSFWDVLFYMNYLGILQPLPTNVAILLGRCGFRQS